MFRLRIHGRGDVLDGPVAGGQACAADFKLSLGAHGWLLSGVLPRTINMITGRSRTADIEQMIQLGAYGPRRLHVLLIEG